MSVRTTKNEPIKNGAFQQKIFDGNCRLVRIGLFNAPVKRKFRIPVPDPRLPRPGAGCRLPGPVPAAGCRAGHFSENISGKIPKIAPGTPGSKIKSEKIYTWGAIFYEKILKSYFDPGSPWSNFRNLSRKKI